MIYILIFIVGLAIGSFLSATAWRLHKQESTKSKTKYSITKGRSMCEHCGHTLGAKDLVPVFSWMSLGGKCRYCKKRLSWEYPAVELLTATTFLLSYMAWDFMESADYFWFVVWLVELSLLLLLAIYDIKWLLLPNKLIYPLIVISVAVVALQSVLFGGGPEMVKDSVLGLLFAGGSFYLLFTASRGKWIGGGDVKLGIFIGISLGLSRSVLALILAFNMAAIVILPLLILKVVNRKTPIPFGPFLIASTIISTLYGYEIIQWYSDTFLYGLL